MRGEGTKVSSTWIRDLLRQAESLRAEKAGPERNCSRAVEVAVGAGFCEEDTEPVRITERLQRTFIAFPTSCSKLND